MCQKAVMFSGLSALLSLSLSLSPAPVIVSPSVTPFMSQCQDVYSSATLLAVLIILAQAAAGGIGCFVRLAFICCWWIRGKTRWRLTESQQPYRPVCMCVCVWGGGSLWCQHSACSVYMDLIARQWYYCNLELIWHEQSWYEIILSSQSHADSCFPCAHHLSHVVLLSFFLD